MLLFRSHEVRSPLDWHVWSVLFSAESVDNDILAAEIWETGTAGIIEESGGLRAFFDDAVAREGVESKWAPLIREIRNEPDAPSHYSSNKVCDPVLVGERFFVVPPGFNGEAPEHRMRISMDAGAAFGTGRHESTKLMVQALESLLRPGDTVVDIGCGSGILSVAARLLNAGRVYSCDIHPDAIDAARRHVDNPLFAGSADAIRSDIADIVLVNISARVIDRVAFDLRRIAKPSGVIVLGGFIRENPPEHVKPRQVFEDGDWLCWICRSCDISASAPAGEDSSSHPQQWWL